MSSIHSPTAQRGGKGTGFVGSSWATENPVTRFTPWRRWCRKAPKGGKATSKTLHRVFESAKVGPYPAHKRAFLSMSDHIGCTTLLADKTLYAVLTANRQPSRRPVFNSICLIIVKYRDPSLSLRMTVEGGKAKRVTLTSNSSPAGRYHNPQRLCRCQT